MEYILFTIFLSSFAIYEVIKNKKSKKLWNITIVVYILFFAFRGLSGFDLKEYMLFFRETGDFLSLLNNDISLKFINLELGFQVLISIIKIFTNKYEVFSILITIIDILIIWKAFYKLSPYPILSLAIFMGLGGLIQQLNLLRNTKGILIFIYSLTLLEKNKAIYIFSNIVGMTIHRSSVIYILLTDFFKRKWYKYNKIIILYFAIGLIISIFKINIISFILINTSELLEKFNLFPGIIYKIKYYLNIPEFIVYREIGENIIEKIFTFILIYFYREKINNYKYGKIFFNIYLIYI